MAKAKAPTPQEIYRARKQREEEERDAHLPPGLVNHGNTCFMNSVVQGLIATRLLHDLMLFKPIPLGIQLVSSLPIESRRSPLLTNGHQVGLEYEKEWVGGMPLGDKFFDLMLRAWAIQDQHKRQNLSPKEVLAALGKKYDQYLDFRQQDAHEFLRLLLDAMRMEEQDIIKKRQPPPPPVKRKSRKGATPPPSIPVPHTAASTSQAADQITPPSSDKTIPAAPSTLSHPTPPEEKLHCFTDMVFGGRLTSVLVCQSCKHISHTYEDFNDLSLSLKPEDYGRERKRDLFKSFAKRFTRLPQVNMAETTMQRSTSTPASPRESTSLPPSHEFPFAVEPRRRSVDITTDASTVALELSTKLQPNRRPKSPEPALLGGSDDQMARADSQRSWDHVEFTEPPKAPRREKEEDGWTKLSRRISIGLGMGNNRRKSRSRSRVSSADQVALKGLPSPQPDPALQDLLGRADPVSSTPTAVSTTPPAHAPPPASRNSSERVRGRAPQSIPPPVPPVPSPDLRPLSPVPIIPRFPMVSRGSSTSVARPPSPRPPNPPNPSKEEAAYLSRILADITPSSSNPFSLFKGASSESSFSAPSSAAQLMLKMGGLPGIEECLRMFTAVETLDGENMVGCRRCWKIQNGIYQPKARQQPDEEDSDSEEEKPSAEEIAEATLVPTSAASASLNGRSVISSGSSIGSVDGTSSFTTIDPREASCPPSEPPSTGGSRPLPLIPPNSPSSPVDYPATYGGHPIPTISTTAAPDTPISPPAMARVNSGPSSVVAEGQHPDVLLQAPAKQRRRHHRAGASDDSESANDESGDETSGDESDVSGGSSNMSPLPSPGVSPERESINPDQISAPPNAAPSRPLRQPRPKPVIMRPAYKRYLIATPPPVLVIHLKRFQQISKSGVMLFSSAGFKKLDDYVAFPEHLDLTPFLAPKKEAYGLGKGKSSKKVTNQEERCKYRLYAVVVHIGNMLGGHYVAYTALPPFASVDESTTSLPTSVTSKEDKSAGRLKRLWAYISDTTVHLTTLEEVLKAKAYICMYERV